MSSSRRRSRFGPKLVGAPPTKIAPSTNLPSLPLGRRRSGKPLIPQLGDGSDSAKFRRVNQALDEQKLGRNLSTKNLLTRPKARIAAPILTRSALHKEQENAFLSVLATKTRITRHRKTVLEYDRRRALDTRKMGYLAQGKRLQLFQSLLREPLTYVELHRRFGVSKQTITGLVRNGLLEEIWGKSGVGIKFAITNAGKKLLTGQEKSSSDGPQIKKMARFRLNHQTAA